MGKHWRLVDYKSPSEITETETFVKNSPAWLLHHPATGSGKEAIFTLHSITALLIQCNSWYKYGEPWHIQDAGDVSSPGSHHFHIFISPPSAAPFEWQLKTHSSNWISVGFLSGYFRLYLVLLPGIKQSKQKQKKNSALSLFVMGVNLPRNWNWNDPSVGAFFGCRLPRRCATSIHDLGSASLSKEPLLYSISRERDRRVLWTAVLKQALARILLYMLYPICCLYACARPLREGEISNR